jgi:hypothetical protein
MKVIYQTEQINTKKYVTGWTACKDDEGVQLDPKLKNDLRDQYGIPLWELVSEATGEVVASGLTPTSEQIAARSDRIKAADLVNALGKIMVDALKTTSNDVQYNKAVADALRARYNA